MPKRQPPESALEVANQRLQGRRVKIYQRGKSLYLLAVLPPKPGEKGWKQRQIPVGGFTLEGVEWAEAKALELSSELMRDVFD